MNGFRRHAHRAALLAALWSTALCATAQNNDRPPPPPDGRRGPPPEAVAACKGKAEGSKAAFKGRGGEEVKGVCKKLGDVIAVLPEGGRPPPPPPPGERK